MHGLKTWGGEWGGEKSESRKIAPWASPGRAMIAIVLMLVGAVNCTTHIYVGCIGAVVCRPEKPTK